jgi:hypothetical protein
MQKQEELSRFTASGKTFFFNKGKASNGTEYLAINAIYGKGNQERTVLFPAHFLEYFKHIRGAIEKMTGMSFNGGMPSDPAAPITPCPERCPNCNWHLLNAELNK